MLDWQDLTHTYPGAAPIRFPDLRLPAGRHLLLQGASGTGKSTLLALMAGLLRVQAGRLRVADADLAGLSPRALDAWRGQHLGVVPQRLHLSEALSVAENLALPLTAAGLGDDPGRANELLAALGVAELSARKPHQLSVGQAQRVAVARALMRRPALLLADEPSAALDDDHTARMLGLLLEAAEREACTLVIASHDSRVIDRLAARADVSTLRLGSVA